MLPVKTYREAIHSAVLMAQKRGRWETNGIRQCPSLTTWQAKWMLLLTVGKLQEEANKSLHPSQYFKDFFFFYH